MSYFSKKSKNDFVHKISFFLYIWNRFVQNVFSDYSHSDKCFVIYTPDIYITKLKKKKKKKCILKLLTTLEYIIYMWSIWEYKKTQNIIHIIFALL